MLGVLLHSCVCASSLSRVAANSRARSCPIPGLEAFLMPRGQAVLGRGEGELIKNFLLIKVHGALLAGRERHLVGRTAEQRFGDSPALAGSPGRERECSKSPVRDALPAGPSLQERNAPCAVPPLPAVSVSQRGGGAAVTPGPAGRRGHCDTGRPRAGRAG